MDGVTVLNVIESNIGGQRFVGCIVVMVVIALICATIGVIKEKEWLRAIIGVIMSIVGACMAIVLICSPTITQYEVMLSDNVNMTEFTERYRIVSQRGKIFIIEDRVLQQSNKT